MVSLTFNILIWDRRIVRKKIVKAVVTKSKQNILKFNWSQFVCLFQKNFKWNWRKYHRNKPLVWEKNLRNECNYWACKKMKFSVTYFKVYVMNGNYVRKLFLKTTPQRLIIATIQIQSKVDLSHSCILWLYCSLQLQYYHPQNNRFRSWLSKCL